MAISLDSKVTDVSFGGGASQTLSSVVLGGSVDCLEIQWGGYTTVSNISSITWNGSSMGAARCTAIASSDSEEGAVIYALKGPTTGTHDAVINFSPNSPYGGTTVLKAWIGVDQTTPVDATANQATHSTSSPESLNITTSSGGVASDILILNGSPTVDASQTQDLNAVQGGDYGASSHKTDAAAMVWTFSGTLRTAHCIIALKAATGGATTKLKDLIGMGFIPRKR